MSSTHAHPLLSHYLLVARHPVEWGRLCAALLRLQGVAEIDHGDFGCCQVEPLAATVEAAVAEVGAPVVVEVLNERPPEADVPLVPFPRALRRNVGRRSRRGGAA